MSQMTACDHCKTTTDSRSRDRWITIRVAKPRKPGRGLFDLDDDDSHDLCSWKCAVEFTSLCALDPTPQEDS
jgi:hypothetical protein